MHVPPPLVGVAPRLARLMPEALRGTDDGAVLALWLADVGEALLARRGAS